MLTKLTKLGRKARVMQHIRGIKSRDFSIIASNCTGTLPYRFLDMEYLTPTANLFFHAPCYLKFATRLEHYLAQPLRFTGQSRYPHGHAIWAEHGRYPIGILDDIEIHFMHYASEHDAEDKWNRRRQRVNRQHLIFSFTDRDLCTPDLLRQFDEIPGRKLLLTARPMPWLKSAIYVPAYRGQSEMGDAYTNYHFLQHVNYRRLIDDSPLDHPIESITSDALATLA